MRDTVRRTGAATVAIVVLATVLLVGRAGAQASPPDNAAGLSAAELDASVLSMSTELAGIDADIGTGSEQRSHLDAAITDGRAAYQRGLDAESASRSALARYSVAAYMVGEIVPPEITNALLTSGTGDLDIEGRRVLATTVHGELTGRARQATSDLDDVVVRLDRDEAAATELDGHLAALTERRATLAAELETTRVEAARTRAREEAEAAAAARREAEERLRAATPRPESFHSGVVPAPTVRPEIVSLLGGEISRTALDAYWHAAAITNGARPGCGVDWALIAAIGKVETGHATYRGTSLAADGSTTPTIIGIPLDGSSGTLRVGDTDGGSIDGDPIVDRAVGPMQFIPGTWRAYAADGNGDGVADPHNIYDAAVATGNYLCSSAGGAISNEANASRAVYAYNRSAAYNAQVLDLADHYRRVVDPSLPPRTPVSIAPPDPAVLPPPASPDVPKIDPGPDPVTTTTSTTAPDPTSTSTTTTTAP